MWYVKYDVKLDVWLENHQTINTIQKFNAMDEIHWYWDDMNWNNNLINVNINDRTLDNEL